MLTCVLKTKRKECSAIVFTEITTGKSNVFFWSKVNPVPTHPLLRASALRLMGKCRFYLHFQSIFNGIRLHCVKASKAPAFHSPRSTQKKWWHNTTKARLLLNRVLAGCTDLLGQSTRKNSHISGVNNELEAVGLPFGSANTVYIPTKFQPITHKIAGVIKKTWPKVTFLSLLAVKKKPTERARKLEESNSDPW